MKRSYFVAFAGFLSLFIALVAHASNVPAGKRFEIEKELIALTRKIDDYISIWQIKQDTFKETEVPITDKNRLLFGQIGNPSAFNENNNNIFDIH